MILRIIFYFCLVMLCIAANQGNCQNHKPRLIITADPELDDNNSLIRLILYSTDFDIEGLIYTSSQFHWTGDDKGTKWFVPGREYDRFNIGGPYESWRWHKGEKFIHNIIDAYEKSYNNLKVHNPSYPAPSALRSKIRYGNIEFDSDVRKDTPGSELIKSLIMDNKPSRLFITAWGGHSTIARALLSIKHQYEYTTEWESIQKKVSSKVVLLPSGDQDDTYTLYIKPYWPNIEYRQFTKGPNYSYGAQLNANETNKNYLTADWMLNNVTSKGHLGDLYRVWGDGKQMVEGDVVDYFGLDGYTDDELRKKGYKVWMPVQTKGSWLGEGDNHTFMNMLDNGLRAYEDGKYGGWGGVSLPKDADILYLSVDSSDQAMAEKILSISNNKNEFPDFFADAQNDFAARMHWSVSSQYKNANHHPNIELYCPELILVNAGQSIKLFAEAKDPDGDQVFYHWWQFMLAPHIPSVEISDKNRATAMIKIPNYIKSGESIHIILEVKDDGKPSLTSYKRVILKIR